MSSTTRNMWKVVCDRKCAAMVMLSDLVEDGMVISADASYSVCVKLQLSKHEYFAYTDAFYT